MKTIVFNKNNYSSLHLQSYITSAARQLNGMAFKLYIYLLFNINEPIFVLRPRTFNEVFGGTDNGMRNGVRELIKLGYLVEQGDRLVFNFILEE